MDLQTKNMKRKLPPGWEIKLGLNGRLYYYSGNSKTVQTLPPKNCWHCRLKLPYGWEMALDIEGRPYFINHIDQTVTYDDPRSDSDDTSESSITEAPPQPRKCEIHRDPEIGFGFIAGSEKPVIIRSVTPGGPSDGKLLPGDQIVQVDWHHVMNAPREDVIELIRRQVDSVTLTVLQPNPAANSSFLKPEKKGIHPSERPKVRFSDDVSINNQEKTEGSSPLLIRPGVLRIHLENRKTKSFEFTHETLAADVIASLCTSFGFKDPNLFALVLTPPHSEPETSDIKSSSSRTNSSSMSSYSIRSDVISEGLVVAPWDSLSKVVNNVAVKRHTCRFRMMYMAKDFHTLSRNDPEAFKYLYVQCIQDVAQEDVFYDQLTEDEYLKLASIHMQETLIRSTLTGKNGTGSKFNFNNLPNKLNLKQFEKEYGLKTFLPTSFLHRMHQEGRNVRKILQQYLKEQAISNSPILSPSVTNDQSALTQLRLHYLKILAPQHLFGGRYFEACLQTLMDSDVVLLIGHHYGVSEIINAKTKMVSVLANFRNISKLEVSPCSPESSKTALNIECYDGKVLAFMMTPLSAHNMALMVSGYCRVHGNADMELTLPTPESVSEPIYFGMHKVVASSWNYPCVASSPSAPRQYFFCDFSEPVTTAILATPDNEIFENCCNGDYTMAEDSIGFIDDVTDKKENRSLAPRVMSESSLSEGEGDWNELMNVIQAKEDPDRTVLSTSTPPRNSSSGLENGIKEDINSLNEDPFPEPPNDENVVYDEIVHRPLKAKSPQLRLSTFKPQILAEDEKLINETSDNSISLSSLSDTSPKHINHSTQNLALNNNNNESKEDLITSNDKDKATLKKSKDENVPGMKETEELIQYFKEKASESRNASNSSLDKIDENSPEIPITVHDLAYGNKKLKNSMKHKSLDNRMSWAVGDSPDTYPPAGNLKKNKYSFSNPDVHRNGVWKKHRKYGFLRFFHHKKRRNDRMASSLTNLQKTGKSEDDLRTFDLADGVKTRKRHKGFFAPLRRVFGGSSKKSRMYRESISKNKKGFSLRDLTKRKKTTTGSLDITVIPSDEDRGVDLLPAGKYAVRESIFKEEEEEELCSHGGTLPPKEEWAASVPVVLVTSQEERNRTKEMQEEENVPKDTKDSNMVDVGDVKMRTSSNSNGARPASFTTFQHMEGSDISETDASTLNKIEEHPSESPYYDEVEINSSDHQKEEESELQNNKDEEISSSTSDVPQHVIAIKRKPSNRPPQKPARQGKKLLPASSPVAPEVVFLTPKVVKTKQCDVRVEEHNKSSTSFNQIESLSPNLKVLHQEENSNVMRRKSTKRRAPSPPTNVAPYQGVEEVETTDSVKTKESLKKDELSILNNEVKASEKDDENLYENIEDNKEEENEEGSENRLSSSLSDYELRRSMMLDGNRNSLLTEIYTYLDKKEKKEEQSVNDENLEKDSPVPDPQPYSEEYELPGVKSVKEEVSNNEKYKNSFQEQKNLLHQVLLEDFKDDLSSLTLGGKSPCHSTNEKSIKYPESYIKKPIHVDEQINEINSIASDSGCSSNESNIHQSEVEDTIKDGLYEKNGVLSGSSSGKVELCDDILLNKNNLIMKLNSAFDIENEEQNHFYENGGPNLSTNEFDKSHRSTPEDELHGCHMPSPIKQAAPRSFSFISYHNLITPVSFTSKTNTETNSANVIHSAPHLHKKIGSPKPPIPPKPTVSFTFS